jgi:hypothetical protein|tara:strand:- start:29 stop:433 length:405 start_codon:yes stop_codon:yes gene_type:complete
MDKKKSIKQIITDLVESLKFHQHNMKQVSSDYYNYDRGLFMKMYYDMDKQQDVYGIDIETLSTLCVQIHQIGHIVHINDEGKDIRTNKVIEEKKTLPLMKQKEIEWERNSKELRDLIRKREQRIKKEKEDLKNY